MTETEGCQAATDAKAAFDKYDRNKSSFIEIEELRFMLQDLNLLTKCKTVEDVDSFVVQQFAAADADKDSRLSREEFEAYYTKVTAPKLSELLARECPGKVERLQKVFNSFASFGSRQLVEDMDGARFSKLCKDTGLVCKALTSTDVDIIFAKTKDKGERRINFDQFLAALEMVGVRRGEDVWAVFDRVLESEGPSVNVTVMTEFVKLHDDKSMYTGVYSRGGPLTVEVPKDPFAAYVSRDSDSPAFSASRRTGSGGTPGGSRCGTPTAGGGRGGSTPTAAGGRGASTPSMLTPSGSYVASERRPITRSSTAGEGGSGIVVQLREVFNAFATFGQGSMASPRPPTPTTPTGTANKIEMDSTRFAKLCRESGLLDAKLTTTAVDLCFTKAKTRSARRITFPQFLEAIELLAQEKGVAVDEVKERLAGCEPLLHNTTKAEYVKHYDDKSTWTGVHVHGGPSTSNDKLTAERLMNRRLSLPTQSPRPSPRPSPRG